MTSSLPGSARPPWATAPRWAARVPLPVMLDVSILAPTLLNEQLPSAPPGGFVTDSSTDLIHRSRSSTVFDLFRARVLLHPSRVAVQDARGAYTYRELEDRSVRLAGALAARGIRRGDPIAILSENRVEYLQVVLAAARLGAVVACLNWRLTAREIDECLNVVTPSLVVVSPRHRQLLAAASDDPPATLVIGDALEAFLAADTHAAGEDVTGEDVTGEDVDPEDPLLVLYTSG